MNELFYVFYLFYKTQLESFTDIQFILVFFPIIILIELPFYVVLISAILRLYLQEFFFKKEQINYFPNVSCIVCAYNENERITKTIASLVEQIYPGNIEILIIVDDSKTNIKTFGIAQRLKQKYQHTKKRHISVIPKKIRGGHASSLNLGLKLAKGELIVSIDGDCSCDNDLVRNAVNSFIDQDVVAISGTLRVRNARQNLLTRLQAVEYMLGISLSRAGLGMLNMMNTVSSALGVYNKDFVIRLGGWKSGSAEDLDLTLRMQSYFKRYPKLKIIHNPSVIAHTDVPTTWRAIFKQRLRWDGDIYYIHCFRHWRILRPKFLSWKGFIGVVWNSLLMHIILPFITLFGFVCLFSLQSMLTSLFILLIVYWYYFMLNVLLFMIYFLLISERKFYDISFVPILLLMPIYNLIMRMYSAIAIVCEIILKSHKDTSMSPWWVNRKTH